MTTPPPPPEGFSYSENDGLAYPESDDDKTMGMIAHGGAIFLGFWAPLLIMIIKKESPFAQQEAKEALNFQILLAIAYLVSFLLMFVCVGFITFVAAWIVAIVFGVQGAMANNQGRAYRYPFNWRIVK